MNTMRWSKWICAATTIGFLAQLGACRPKVDPTSAETRDSAEGKACPPDVGMISDVEADNKTNFIQGRGGYWYTFVDKAGSDVWPLAGALGGTFESSKGGANGTAHAACMKGKVGGGDTLYAGMGLNFLDPKGQYDASKFQGLTFWAKKGPGSTGNVRLKVPDVHTDPEGGICKDCYNDFGADLQLTDVWTQYTFPFTSLKQVKTWGDQFADGIDPKKIYGMQWQVNEPGATFDICVDEIQFTGCQ